MAEVKDHPVRVSVGTARIYSRDELVEIVAQLIAEDGIASCTFRNLSERAGTSTRPFTHAFGSRAQMLAAVADHAWNQLGLDGPLDGLTGEIDPLTAFKSLCSKSVPINEENSQWTRIYAMTLMHAQEDPALADAIREADREGASKYLAMIRDIQDAGMIDRSRDAEDLLAAIWALCDGLLLAAFLHPDYFTSERTRRVWNQAFDALIAGSG